MDAQGRDKSEGLEKMKSWRGLGGERGRQKCVGWWAAGW